MTVFSVTDMAGKEDCRRRWYQSSLSGLALEPWLPAKPLILGTLGHSVLADWSVAWAAGDRSKHLPVALFDTHWGAASLKIRERYSQKYGGPADFREPGYLVMSDAEFLALYGEDVGQLGRAMIGNYVEYYGKPYPDESYELVQVEQTITVPVPGTEHHACDDTTCKCVKCLLGDYRQKHLVEDRCEDSCGCVEPHYLEGTFDMLLADKKDRLLIPDHKTYERRPTDLDLQQNDQFLKYHWIVGQALPERECIGVLYNGLWKRATPPKGRVFDDLFYRELITHDEEEIEEIGMYLPHQLWEMEYLRTHPESRWPRRSWSTCPNCGMQDLCVAMSRGEPTEDFMADYTQRERTPAWRWTE